MAMTGTSHRVSIIIRNCNCAQFLTDAIESALGQDYPDVQLIVVDDGSTDGSRDLLRHYSDRCELVLQENAGEGAAVNAGFAQASGDIVMFLDADDVLASDAVSEIVARWTADIARIHFPLQMMDENGNLHAASRPAFRFEPMSIGAYLERYGEAPSGSLSCNAFASWALKNILPVDPVRWRRAVDAYVNALTTAQGKIKVIERPLGAYRIHSASWTCRLSASLATEADVLHVHPRLHADIRRFVGESAWSEMQPRLPTFHWLNRLLSLRLNPEHPFVEDRVGRVARACLASIMARPHTSAGHRLLLLGALCSAVVLPRGILGRLLPSAIRMKRRWEMKSPLRPRTHWRAAFVFPAGHRSASNR